MRLSGMYPAVGAGLQWHSLRMLLMLFVLFGSIARGGAAKHDADSTAAMPVFASTKFDNLPANYQYLDDSPVILYHDGFASIAYRSDDDGKTWAKIPYLVGETDQVLRHPFDNQQAFILGTGKTHYRTANQGKTWHKFETEFPHVLVGPPMAFSAAKSDYILFFGLECEVRLGWFGYACKKHAYYTKNSFDTIHSLESSVEQCIFTRAAPEFKESDRHQILCVQADPDMKGRAPDINRLVTSDDWFKTKEEVVLQPGQRTRGIIAIGPVQTFLVAGARSSSTEEMMLFVSDDGATWDLAKFPTDHGGVKQNAYTILESTPYSLKLDALSYSSYLNPMGTILTSNSNGSYFTRSLEHTNRNPRGFIDYESVTNLQGITLANVVANWEQIENLKSLEKKIQTRISFNDGRSWSPIPAPSDSKCQDEKKCHLHLHSMTEHHNTGKIFSTTAPGILIGVGSVGEALQDYEKCNTYVSEDGGFTWRLSIKGPAKYEIGDQGSIIVAIADMQEATSEVMFSTTFGREWKTLKLDKRVLPHALTTVPDSTIRKFSLVGLLHDDDLDDDNKDAVVYSLDFTSVFDRKCVLDKKNEKNGDFQKWYARYDGQGQPACIMGQKQFYWRKRMEHDCYVGEDYHEPDSEFEFCECSDEDFECDYNFKRSEKGECVPALPLKPAQDQCKKPSDTFEAPSGYRLIPGNMCARNKDKPQKDAPVQRKCGDNKPDEPSGTPGEVSVRINNIPGDVREFYYLERSETSTGDDETIVLRNADGEIFVSHDNGGDWIQILKDTPIESIYRHDYFYDYMFFFTSSKEAFITRDRAKTVTPFNIPAEPNNIGLLVLSFHPDHPDWLIFTTSKGCDDILDKECHANAFYTLDGGETWDDLASHIRTCSWLKNKKLDCDEKLIVCEKLDESTGQQGPPALISSSDFFDSTTQLFDKIVGFALFEEFIIVATFAKESQSSLSLFVSVNGLDFAHGKFPPFFNVHAQQAYTVLDSITHSVFLHVTTNADSGSEWGSLLKSNSNGTYYVRSVDYVNRNTAGFVDFEKMPGLEGVAIINTVKNAEEILAAKKPMAKKLKSQMTFDDGAQWSYLKPPAKGADGKRLCSGSLEKCSLNLHGYTERRDFRDTMASGSAISMMMGVGNAGPYLGDYKNGDLYLTNDGGITWKQVAKGPYMFEYGDQGSYIVAVPHMRETDSILYSLDLGATWKTFKFSDETKYMVDDIVTVPSDTSRRFLLFVHPAGENGQDVQRGAVTVSIDFSGLTSRQCVLDLEHPNKDDFELWSPRHPDGQGRCLFGHEIEYFRRRVKSDCYVGRKIPQPSRIVRNCACARADFECDYNYERASDGSCQLIPGLDPPDHQSVCKDPNVFEYFSPTGYRRIAMTTCEGGKEYDRTFPKPCPGRDGEFSKHRRGLHGFGLFLVIVLPIGFAGVMSYAIYQRTKGMGLGQIRLGDSSLEDHAVFGGVTRGLDVVAAQLTRLPIMLSEIYERLREAFPSMPRYASRQSFASAAQYSAIDNIDDAELLGEVDSDGEL